MPSSHPSNNGKNERIERLLRGAGDAVSPSRDVQEGIKTRMLRRIETPAAIRSALEASRPAEDVHGRLKANILARILPDGAGILDRLRASFTPPPHVHLWLRSYILGRIETVPAQPFLPRLLRWTAAFAFVLLAVRSSPLFFVAPPLRADSSVLLVPMEGEVSVLLGGLWQPVTEEITLQGEASVRTGDAGYATIIVHDDGVLRLAPGTTFTVRDITDRPTVAAVTPSFSLDGGMLWAQAFIPEAIGPGWVVDVGQGTVRLNEGSVSIARVDGKTDVEVWDRHARVGVTSVSWDTMLVAGEGAKVTAGRSVVVRKLSDDEANEAWVEQNLRRDAVHRREIAFLQKERRAKNAGILPTSTLYPVKRVAEAVDVLFTFGEGARAQKRLQQASTRLNEAAALLESGSGSQTEAAQRSLDEYRQTLLSVATGSGQDVQTLVQQQVLSEVADISAALPDDEGYLLKKTVMETSAEIPGSQVKAEDVQEAMVVDTLASLTLRAQEGDVQGAADGFKELLPSLALAQQPTVDRDVRRETEAALEVFAGVLREEAGASGTGTLITQELSPYLPVEEPAAPVIRSLTEAEVEALAQQIYDRVFGYKMPRSRYNQLLAEFRSLEGNPDQGRILRQLYRILPENGLGQYVRTEFQRVREQVQGK